MNVPGIKFMPKPKITSSENTPTPADTNIFNQYNNVIFICESGPLFYISMDIDSKFKQRKDVWANYRSLPVEFEGIYFCHIAKTKDDDEHDEHAVEVNPQADTDGDSG